MYIKNVVPIWDSGNIMLLLMLWAVIGIPLSVLTVALFFAVRWVPSRPAQCLILLVAGILLVVASLSMEPPGPGNSEALRFLTGIFIHPLLFLPPVMVLQKYLHRIPLVYAVFFAALISSCVLISLGALQGERYYVDLNGVQVFWEATVTVIKDVITASAAFGLIIGLDTVLAGSKKIRELDSAEKTH
jgi:hypothetical protein